MDTLRQEVGLRPLPIIHVNVDSKTLLPKDYWLSEVVKMWAEQVFEEYGLDLAEHTYGSTSDSGSD